ncbi:MAG: DUF2793 domain-containing protein [Hyphomicrobiaceae bacterium]
MSDLSSNLELPYIAAAQAQKHVTHNEAIRKLDAIVQLAVLDRDLSAPPASPNEGDRYIVAATPTGDWENSQGSVAAFQDGAWALLAPRQGWTTWVADEAQFLVFDGSGWIPVPGGGGSGSVNPTPLVGVNATADSTNKLTVKSDSVLLSHDDVTPGSGDSRVTINKSTDTDVASVVFQTNYSGRAEFGVTSSNLFELKVSADGSNFEGALNIDPASAKPHFPKSIVLGEDENDSEAVELSNRGDETPNYGIATLRARGTDTPTVLDIVPNGTGGSDITGRAWIHVLNSDISTAVDPTQWQACTMSARPDENVLGSMSGGGMPVLPIAIAGAKVNLKSQVTGAGTVSFALFDELGFRLLPDTTPFWMYSDWTRFKAGYQLNWVPVGDAYGTPDVGLTRSAPEILEVNNGTAGSLAQLKVRSVKVATYTVATVPSAVTEGDGAVIYISDASVGATLCVSDGTQWRMLTSSVLT